MKGKLSARWSEPWKVEGMKNATTVVLRMGAANRTVHVNHVRPLLEEDVDYHVPSDWVPPCFHMSQHFLMLHLDVLIKLNLELVRPSI